MYMDCVITPVKHRGDLKLHTRVGNKRRVYGNYLLCSYNDIHCASHLCSQCASFLLRFSFIIIYMSMASIVFGKFAWLYELSHLNVNT